MHLYNYLKLQGFLNKHLYFLKEHLTMRLTGFFYTQIIIVLLYVNVNYVFQASSLIITDTAAFTAAHSGNTGMSVIPANIDLCSVKTVFYIVCFPVLHLLQSTGPAKTHLTH